MNAVADCHAFKKRLRSELPSWVPDA